MLHVAEDSMANVIEVAGLTKRFGSLTAVDDVSFSVERGAIFGLLGKNGAGKTTTVEILEGYQSPDQVGSRCSVSTPRKGAALGRTGSDSSCKTRISTPPHGHRDRQTIRRLLLTSQERR